MISRAKRRYNGGVTVAAAIGPPAAPDLDRIRALVLAHGWNATAFQIVNPGIDHWFSAQGDAVIGYVRRAGTRVVAGAPVCAEERLPEVLTEWEGEARRAGDHVGYFGAAGRLHTLLEGRTGYATVVLGSQPVWSPADWAEVTGAVPSLRQQLSRARNKGVTVREWSTGRAENDAELCRVLGEWLGRRGLPPLGFLVEPQTLARLTGRRVFVAERGGRPVGFTVLSPVPARRGWLTEQFPRGHGAPNGTVELLLDSAVRAVAAGGAEYVTMGLVPLSRNTWLPEDYNPLWLRLVLTWVRAHGNRFYNFAGLDAFKSKFRPQAWEPIYAISNEPRFSPRSLWAIAAAFSGDRSPIALVARGLAKAVRQEARWLRERTGPAT